MLKRFLLAAAIILAAALPSQAANQFADNVCETTATAGTGTLDLGGAPATGRYVGARSFLDAGITSGSSVPYSIDTGSGVSRKVEIGWGTFTDASPDTLTRDASSTTDDSSAPITELTLSGTSVVCIGVNSLLLTGGAGYGINADLIDSINGADLQLGPLSGDVVTSGATATIQGNSVALTTDTTGNYAAGDAEAGAALTGDTATAFFSAGTIEDARIDGSAEADEVNPTLGTQTQGNYALGDAEGGAATTGDSATSFFSTGTIEDARIDGSAEVDEVLNSDLGDFTCTAGSCVIDANAVALGTDTSGNYVDDVTGSATGGIAVTHTPAEGSDPALAFDFTDKGADPALAADSCVFSGDATTNGEIVCEGDTANTIESRIVITDPTASDKAFTIPDANSYPIVDKDYGDITVSASGQTWSVDADSIVIGTDTTGVYVAQVADGTGIDGSCNAEACTYTPSLDLTEINSFTLGAGAATGITFDAGATDPVLTSASASITWSGITTYNLDDEAELRIFEEDAGGSNYKGFKAPAALTASTTCTFEDDANFIPDSCVGDGTDATGLSDGDKGDVTVSSSGTVVDIDPTITVGSGSAITWTFDAGATDPVFTFGSGELEITAANVFFNDSLIGTRSDTNHGMLHNATVDGPEFRGFGGFMWKVGVAGATEVGRYSSNWQFLDDVEIDNANDVRFLEGDGGGSNYKGFSAPATITSDTTCTFEDDANFIPDSCVGDGSDANTLGSDGDKGDITVGGTGTTLTIDTDAVTYAKMQNVSADERIIGRVSGAGGDPEELTATQVEDFLEAADGSGSGLDADLLDGVSSASFVQTSRAVNTSGLASGGGNLSADRTITVSAASQGDQETGTSTSTAVQPGVQHYHQSAAKNWNLAEVSGGVPSNTASYNITSITDTATGRLLVTFNVDFSATTAYECTALGSADTTTTAALDGYTNHGPSRAVGTIEINRMNGAGSLEDPSRWNQVCFGDL